MPQVSTQILLAARPVGMPTAETFRTVETPLPPLADGQVLCRTIYLSLDPYMRGRMNAGKSYVAPAEVGQAMCGGTVSQVIESRSPALAAGDFVLGYDGWQSHAVGDASAYRKLDPAAAPISYALGILGMPGMTAYVGMLDILRPQAGQTVVVSAAAGAVGSAAGQIAKTKGCRVVGSAGSDDKCRFVTEECGFDACFNYKSVRPFAGLRRNCPEGIDAYYDNVGGDMLEAVLRLINVGGRVALVGMISQYNATSLEPGPNLAPLLVRRAMIQGMIVNDHADRQADFLRDMTAWVREGKIKVRETIIPGLENAPTAFLGLFSGQNVGKLLVAVSPDPTRQGEPRK